jgi:signal transduction histidine kinase
VSLTFDDAPALPPVHGVAGQLYQALLNVLTNAVQAARGTVRVTVWADDGTVGCRVADDGPGVPPEQLGRIFEPLYTTKPGGHGLGLALTYQFVRAHGGEVRAECPPTGGLAITLTFPARQETEVEAVCI